MSEEIKATITEEQLSKAVAVSNAETSISVTNDEEFKQAAEVVQDILRREAMVKNYFGPLKESANKLHKDLCAREKAFLRPLDQAHNAVKAAMTDYHTAQEAERKKKEQEKAEERKAYAEELLRQADEAAAIGDMEAAAQAKLNAELISNAIVTVQISAPKVSGVSTVKEYKVVVVDCKAVPDVFEGVEIRPIDNAALERIARRHEGNVEIPGCLVSVTEKVVVRSK